MSASGTAAIGAHLPAYPSSVEVETEELGKHLNLQPFTDTLAKFLRGWLLAAVLCAQFA